LAITWSKFGVKEKLKLQNHSNNYELSENAIKESRGIGIKYEY